MKARNGVCEEDRALYAMLHCAVSDGAILNLCVVKPLAYRCRTDT